ncbi:hypothetical protein CFBP3840_P100122 (plasmid) [Pseudomonas syringae]|uniref:Uncharacterized protein n=1 Tax=Pseudomonas syringae TaxID=317 RepID=A0A2K4X3E1_PSESX|nr:hypothetical protein CFBP3840_P100122 [Pseudomonas syringae]
MMGSERMNSVRGAFTVLRGIARQHCCQLVFWTNSSLVRVSTFCDQWGLLLESWALACPKPTPYSAIQMNLIWKEHHHGSDERPIGCRYCRSYRCAKKHRA